MKVRLLLIGFILLFVAGTLAFAGKEKGESVCAEFSVRKLTCIACAKKIEKSLADLPGITKTEVDVAAGRARVTFDPARVSAATIAETISAAGYPAGLLRIVADGPATAAATTAKPAAGAGCACCN